MQNELEPVTILPPAPVELLNTLFCNCKNGRGVLYGCRKSRLQITLVCGQCNGQACINVVSSQSDSNEESAFDLQSLEDLETMIHDNKDDDNEIDIFTCPKDEVDEEEN